MYSYETYFGNNYYNTKNPQTAKAKNAAPVASEPKKAQVKHKFTRIIKEVPFNPSFTASSLRTRLSSNEEKQKYNNVQKNLSRHTCKELEALLKKGILLNSNSSDGSSVLDNLDKILTTPRAEGLNSKQIAQNLIETLNNPSIITQQFGNIPKNRENDVIDVYMQTTGIKDINQAREEVNVTHSGTCVAASIEYSMARKNPAEFSRFTEGLTSPNVSVDKKIHLNKLADNTLDAIWLLNAFEIPYKDISFNEATLTFKPDSNAIVRAKIQTEDYDKGERTPIDVLMQSSFMQVGSQQAYNGISDKRAGKFNQNDKGLIEFEKTFTESVVEDENKISVTYQKVDENARLTGYETDWDTMKRHLTQTLDMGDNVIIGYTQTDNNNIIINGHEITIIGYKKDRSGKLSFICNDTDDNSDKTISYSEDYLLPKIHHAALPKQVVENDVKMVENWVEGLEKYKEQKQQLKQADNQAVAA